MLECIGKLSLSTLRKVPMCQGFSHFSGFLHHLVLATLATSSIRVKNIPKMLSKESYYQNRLASYCTFYHWTSDVLFTKIDWLAIVPSIIWHLMSELERGIFFLGSIEYPLI